MIKKSNIARVYQTFDSYSNCFKYIKFWHANSAVTTNYKVYKQPDSPIELAFKIHF